MLKGIKTDYFDRLWLIYKRLEQRVLKYMVHVFETAVKTGAVQNRKATTNFANKVKVIKTDQEEMLYSMLELYRE